jgi:glyoxylase-like metal-dependent hydrolase (beta-lactamase superfamily II)
LNEAGALAVQLRAGIRVLERGWLSSNNVMLTAEGGHAVAVVDTGHVRHAAQTVALVEAGAGHGQLRAIFNTHLHSDHCGGNAALEKHFGVGSYIPPGDFEAAVHWDEERLSFRDTGQACQRFTPAGRLVPGQTLPAPFDRWEIHAAPGHDPASVILFEPASRVLMSADALWENGFGIVFPDLRSEDGFEEVVATLNLIESLKPAHVIPGHGAPFDDVTAALARARDRARYFQQEPRRHALHAAKALTVFHVMEVGAIRRMALLEWALGTPVFQRMAASLLSPGGVANPFDRERRWVSEMLDALIAAGALVVASEGSDPMLRPRSG